MSEFQGPRELYWSLVKPTWGSISIDDGRSSPATTSSCSPRGGAPILCSLVPVRGSQWWVVIKNMQPTSWALAPI